MILQKKMIIY